MGNLKLINSVIFFVIIWATQCLVGVEKSVSFEQHVQVQQELSQLIGNYIKENLPEMTNFKMHSLYTKPPKKGMLEAYFNYSFTTTVAQSAQQATTELTGVAVLRKLKDLPQQEWALEKIEIEGEAITFEDPITITGDKNATPEIETPAPKAEHAKAPAPAKEVAPAAPAETPAAPKVETTPEARQ